eukprot:Colp12_sorted_trinity150504_noHs@13328
MESSQMVDRAEPKIVRQLIRSKKLQGPSTGLCPGYLQCNVVMVHKDEADDYEKFCKRNSQAAPLLYRSQPGQKDAGPLASDSNIASDIAKYRIYKDGILIEETNCVEKHFHSDMVTFYIGCSFSFEELLLQNGVPLRNIEQKKNVSMYKTNIVCESSGSFGCNLVVSMRPIPKAQVDTVVALTSSMPLAHGSPVHIGDPAVIGVAVEAVDFGEAVSFMPGDTAVVHACGVTAILATVAGARHPVLTHSPRHMFITDVTAASIMLQN